MAATVSQTWTTTRVKAHTTTEKTNQWAAGRTPHKRWTQAPRGKPRKQESRKVRPKTLGVARPPTAGETAIADLVPGERGEGASGRAAEADFRISQPPNGANPPFCDRNISVPIALSGRHVSCKIPRVLQGHTNLPMGYYTRMRPRGFLNVPPRLKGCNYQVMWTSSPGGPQRWQGRKRGLDKCRDGDRGFHDANPFQMEPPAEKLPPAKTEERRSQDAYAGKGSPHDKRRCNRPRWSALRKACTASPDRRG